MRARKLIVFALTFSILSLSPLPASSAAVKPIKVLPVAPTLITNLSGSAGDQISGVATTSTQIALIGTLESATTSTLITSPGLGGSDGFIAAISPSGNHLWDLRLGNSGDEIANAIARDKVGSYWIAGASTKPGAPNQTPITDTQSVNIDGISPDQVITPNNALTQITVWKVSLLGQLQATYNFDAGNLVSPSSISFDGTNFTISGLFADKSFSIKLSQSGEFAKLQEVSNKTLAIPAIQTIKAGTGYIKSYISKGPISGIPSWKTKSAIPVLLEYNKLKTLVRASYFQGKVISTNWQSGVGPIVITERNDGYAINVLGLAK